MALPAGTKLGRYEIRAQLGAGGMGEVYLSPMHYTNKAATLTTSKE